MMNLNIYKALENLFMSEVSCIELQWSNFYVNYLLVYIKLFCVLVEWFLN